MYIYPLIKYTLLKQRILIADDIHPIFIEKVEAAGYQCDYQPLIKLDQALQIIGDYEGLVIRSKFNVDRQVIDAGKKLRFIARAGAGLDNIDEAYAKSKNIQLINASEGNMDAVGEHCVGLLLALMNHFNTADAEIRAGQWKREANRGYELKGKTVGIIGYGFMGRSFAKKLSGFEVDIIAYDKYKTGTRDFIPYSDAKLPDSIELKEVFDFITSDDPQTKVEMQDGSKMNYLPTKLTTSMEISKIPMYSFQERLKGIVACGMRATAEFDIGFGRFYGQSPSKGWFGWRAHWRRMEVGVWRSPP